jgi:nucleotide-binding universal stress UspA family protein
MKTILVPTDFSAHAENALRYAARLNEKLQGRILVFHSYHVPVPATEAPVDLRSEAELKRGALKSLQQLKDSFTQEFPGTTLLVETAAGFADDEIIERARQDRCDYIVMGTHGASGLREWLLGSNTSTVMEKAPCPVFAIPEEGRLDGMKNIVFAADYGMHNYKNALHVVELARLFHSTVTLLHIRSGRFDESTEYAELEGFKSRVTRDSGYDQVTVSLLDGDDSYQTLHQYTEESRPDLLVLSMRNRNFFQKVFSRSLTKRMAHHSSIPMLVLHTGS